VQGISREEEYLLSQNPSLFATKADSQYSKAISILRTNTPMKDSDSISTRQ